MGKEMTSEERRYQEAKKRAEKLRDFYSSLFGFVIFTGIFLIFHSITGWLDIGFVIVVLWGAANVFKAIELFNPFCGERGEEWEARKIAELMGEKPKRTSTDDFFERV